jgi:hypothetical protein
MGSHCLCDRVLALSSHSSLLYAVQAAQMVRLHQGVWFYLDQLIIITLATAVENATYVGAPPRRRRTLDSIMSACLQCRSFVRPVFKRLRLQSCIYEASLGLLSYVVINHLFKVRVRRRSEMMSNCGCKQACSTLNVYRELYPI